MAEEMFPGVLATAMFLPAALFGNRLCIGMAIVSSLMTALRVAHVRRFVSGGVPLAVVEGGTLTFFSRNLWRQFKHFPVAEIEQVRVHGSPARRFFSFKLAGRPEQLIAPAFGVEAEQVIVNFLQKALREKVLVERGRS